MKHSFLNTLTPEQQATVFREFLEQIETINSKCGTVFGTIQIIETLENAAIKFNYRKCPHCGK
jgi:hypothetical protein